jgi:hypothetical protein
MKAQFLFFVVGATSVGKSTFLQTIKDVGGLQVHLVEVGKQMRAKYPPEHFKGQCNPAHTAAEALQMCLEGIEEAGEKAGAKIILVDGQPRDVGQAEEILGWRFQDHRTKAVIHLMCHRDERERRARVREKNNPGALQLALDRLDRDVLQLHEVLITFDRYDRYNFNTGHPNYTPLAAFQEVLRKYGACLLGTNAVPPVPEMSAASHVNKTARELLAAEEETRMRERRICQPGEAENEGQ